MSATFGVDAYKITSINNLFNLSYNIKVSSPDLIHTISQMQQPKQNVAKLKSQAPLIVK